MKIFLFLFALAASASVAKAQKPEDALAYKNGEKLEFVVAYTSKIIRNAEMGSVSMSVSEDMLCDTSAFRIEAHATVLGIFRWFYKLDDYYYSWISRKSLLPMMARAELYESNYRFSSEFNYNWNKMVSSNRWRNHKHPDYKKKDVPLVDGAMDGISLFYHLRSTNFSGHRPGEERSLHLLLEDTVRTIKYKYFGAEMKEIYGLGKVNTIKLSCQLITSEGQRFEDGSEFFIWVTNDRNKIPVLVESPVRVGSIVARLVSYKGLKFPEESVLKKR